MLSIDRELYNSVDKVDSVAISLGAVVLPDKKGKKKRKNFLEEISAVLVT